MTRIYSTFPRLLRSTTYYARVIYVGVGNYTRRKDLDELEFWAEVYNHWMNKPRWQKILTSVTWYLIFALLGAIFAAQIITRFP